MTDDEELAIILSQHPRDDFNKTCFGCQNKEFMPVYEYCCYRCGLTCFLCETCLRCDYCPNCNGDEVCNVCNKVISSDSDEDWCVNIMCTCGRILELCYSCLTDSHCPSCKQPFNQI